METLNRKSSRSHLEYVFAAIAVITLAGLCIGGIVKKYSPVYSVLDGVTDPTKWGTFGDYFGGTLGPILNFCGMVLLLITLLFQRAQLLEARQDADDAQRHMELQRFEQTFFSWLESYRRIVSEFEFREKTGRVALQQQWDSFFLPGHIAYTADTVGLGTFEATLEDINQRRQNEQAPGQIIASAVLLAFDQLYRENISSLDTLFRTLYRLIKWIDQSSLDTNQKFEYVGIVRSQISSIELHLIFLNCLTMRGDKFLAFVNRYALLDNLETDNQFIAAVINWGNSSGVRYADSAYDSNLAREQLGIAQV